MSLLRSVATIGSYTLLCRVFGFIRDVMMTALMGATALNDAFIVAFKLPNFFRSLFAEGAFNVAFVPMFSKINAKEGHGPAFKFANNTFNIMVIFLTLFCVVVIIFMPWVMKYVAYGFTKTPERMALAVDFGRIAFPYILFISLVALFSGMLNGLHRFAAASFAPTLLNIAMIGAMLLSYYVPVNLGFLLVWGVIIGGIAQLALVIIAAKRLKFFFKLGWPRYTEDTKEMLRKMGPSALSAGVTQINLLIGMTISSILPAGNITYFSVAERIYQLPLSIIGVSFGTALLPILSQRLAHGDGDGFQKKMSDSLNYSLLVAIPCTITLMVIAEPIVKIMFERNAFDAEDVAATAVVLAAFASGLPAYIMSKIFSAGFFAQGDTKTPTRLAIVAVGINTALNLYLIEIWGIAGIAWATSLASWFNALMLMLILRLRGIFSLRRLLLKFLPRTLSCCLFFWAILVKANDHWSPLLSGTEWVRMSYLLLVSCVCVAAYAFAVFFFGPVDLRRFYIRFRKLGHKRNVDVLIQEASNSNQL